MGSCNSMNEGRREKKRNVELNETEKAILDCKSCRDKIKGYIRGLEKNELKTKEKAKDLLRNKQRERAKFYVRRGNLYKEQIKIADGQLEMINNQITQIESSATMNECMNCLKNGNTVLKNLQAGIKVEEWENIRDDLDELKEKDKEIGDFLRENNINQQEYDEGVEQELDKLISEVQGAGAMNLPSVPKTEITEDKTSVKIENKKKRIAQVA